MENNFAKAFKESRGNVDPKLKIGFCCARVRFEAARRSACVDDRKAPTRRGETNSPIL
jgi:hypothetical protein